MAKRGRPKKEEWQVTYDRVQELLKSAELIKGCIIIFLSNIEKDELFNEADYVKTDLIKALHRINKTTAHLNSFL